MNKNKKWKESLHRLILKLDYIYKNYGFIECGNCTMPHDEEGCLNCARCDGCLEYCEETHVAPNGDNWCAECIKAAADECDLMLAYNKSR